MPKNFLIFSLTLCFAFTALPSHALFGFGSKEPEAAIPEDNLQILLSGDIENLVKKIEKENKFDWEKEKTNITSEDAELYGAGLIILGEIEKAEKFLGLISNKFKSQKIKDIQKHIDFFRSKFDNPKLNYTEAEKAQIRLLELFPRYLTNKELGLEDPIEALSKAEIKAEIEKTNNRLMYFPSRLEYLLEIKDNQKAKEEALDVINQSREKLFPKTPDFNALAFAHRTLAILANKDGDKLEAEKHFRLALLNIAKLRVAWLEEDIFTGKYIKERHTKVGYVLPQWIIFLRSKFEKEYGLLLNEIEAKN